MKSQTSRRVSPIAPQELDQTQLLNKNHSQAGHSPEEIELIEDSNSQVDQQLKHKSESNLDHEVLAVDKAEEESVTAQPMYNDSMATPFNSRRTFIIKVYGLLTCHLAVTILVAMLCSSVSALQQAIPRYPLLFLLSFVLCIVMMIAIYFCKTLLRKWPVNGIVAGVFTVVVSCLIGFISSQASWEAVLITALMTLSITGGLTVYAWRTKRDFTICSGLKVMLCVALVVFGIFAGIFSSQILTVVFCFLGIIVFGIYIVVDTQLIAGGRFDEFTYDDYILGALMLYIDIIGLFIYLLRLLGNKFAS